MADNMVKDEHLSRVDISSLKELIKELVTWIIDEEVALHPTRWIHFCIDVRLKSEVKPLFDELRKLTPISSDSKLDLFRFESDKPALLHDPLRRKTLLLPLHTISGEPKVSNILLDGRSAIKLTKEVLITPSLYFLYILAS